MLLVDELKNNLLINLTLFETYMLIIFMFIYLHSGFIAIEFINEVATSVEF